ncbi:MAG: hypothetical protein HON90_10410 [Halobacteriovoraceae bacterium]|jgi:hypothetical protein|nr:hypothetical protein [Halobacteriovoraceae bacterium]
MKFILFVLTLCAVQSLWGSSLVWKQQETKTIYKTTKALELQTKHKKLIIPIGANFELYEKSKLNMIKVYLYKYKFSKCDLVNTETDLELINLAQPNGSTSSVGVNLSKGCNVEVFVDFDDYNTTSFFK